MVGRPLALSQYSAKTVMERNFDDQAALNREEERKAKGRAALKKFREKEKREKLEREKRFGHLSRENQDIKQRTAVYREVVIKRYHIEKMLFGLFDFFFVNLVYIFNNQ